MSSDDGNFDLDVFNLNYYKCNECNLMFGDGSNLRRHKRTRHLNEKPYKCNICNKIFGRSDHLKRHIWCHNNPTTKLICNINGCKKSYISTEKLEQHRKIHTNKLSEDVIMIKGYQVKKIINDNVTKLLCPFNNCTKIYNSYAGMIKHINAHNTKKKYKQEAEQVSTGVFKELENYVCPYDNCRRIYTKAKNLKSHMKTVHEVIEYKCDFCDKLFRTKDLLQSHICNHSL